MPSSRSCRSSYDCIVKIKGVTMRPILFSQLMRSDGEGAMNPEELFADDRSPASEQERVHEDELHLLASMQFSPFGDADVFPYESAHILSAIPEPIRSNYLSASPTSKCANIFRCPSTGRYRVQFG